MDSTSVLIEKSHTGDKKAREVLVESNLGLVHHIVKRFMGRGYDAEDLFQIGCIGLMKAIDKFDLQFDVKFSTYAVPMITGEIKRFLRDDGMVKVSRTVKENGWRLHQAREALQYRLGKEPTLMELQQETGMELEEIVSALEAGAEVESIYKAVYQADGNEIYLIDQLVGEYHEKEGLLNRLLVHQLIEELSGEERRLIYLRYYQEQTQSEIAEKLGISQVQVSRMEKKILQKMRGKIQ